MVYFYSVSSEYLLNIYVVQQSHSICLLRKWSLLLCVIWIFSVHICCAAVPQHLFVEEMVSFTLCHLNIYCTYMFFSSPPAYGCCGNDLFYSVSSVYFKNIYEAKQSYSIWLLRKWSLLLCVILIFTEHICSKTVPQYLVVAEMVSFTLCHLNIYWTYLLCSSPPAFGCCGNGLFYSVSSEYLLNIYIVQQSPSIWLLRKWYPLPPYLLPSASSISNCIHHLALPNRRRMHQRIRKRSSLRIHKRLGNRQKRDCSLQTAKLGA